MIIYRYVHQGSIMDCTDEIFERTSIEECTIFSQCLNPVPCSFRVLNPLQFIFLLQQIFQVKKDTIFY
jgi:hypothetical protein